MQLYPKVRILDLEESNPATLLLTLQKPPGFSFAPGQYVMITNDPQAFKGRAFSLASAPSEPNLLIGVRSTDSPFVTTLRSLKIGSNMQVHGPFGRLALPTDTSRPVALVAGGIGITPFRSMIIDESEKNFPHEIFLFYANRQIESIAFLGELKKISHPRFHLILTIEHAPAGWMGETGFINEVIFKKYITDKNPRYLVVGPPPMVEAVTTILQSLAVDKNDIVTEKFTGHK